MNKKLISAISVIFIIVITVFVYYAFFTTENNSSESDYHSQVKLSGLSPDINKSIMEAAENAKKFKDEKGLFFDILKRNKISNKMNLVIEVAYKDGSMKKMMTSMPKSFSGLSISELDSILEEWNIERYSPGKVLVLNNINKYQLPDSYYIAIKNEKVAIYYDKELSHLKQLTDIDVNELPLEERKLLKKGIKAESKEELLAILESLRSIIEEK